MNRTQLAIYSIASCGLGQTSQRSLPARVRRDSLTAGHLKANLLTAFIDTGAAQGAFAIGEMKQAGTLDAFTHKLAHALAGCAAGAASAGGDGCAPGAIGAALGEISAEAYGRKSDTVEFAAMISGIGAALAGGDASQISLASAAGANAAANNRMLHSDQYAYVKKNARQVTAELSKREEREVSVDEAEGRMVAEILRNSDQQANQAAGGIHDYSLRSIVSCQNLACDLAATDPVAYKDPAINQQYIAPNSNSYAKGLSFNNNGLTYNQLVEKNVRDNPASTGIAGAAMTATGIAVAGPATLLPRVLAGGTGAGANALFQQAGTQPTDWLDVGIAGFTGFITGGASSWMQGLGAAGLINVGGALTGSAIKGENPNAGMGGAAVGTAIGYPIGKAVEAPINKALNP